MMALISAIPALVTAVGAAVAVELRRVSEVHLAVVQQRSASATARASARQRPSA